MKLWKTNNKYFEIPSPHGPNHCGCSFIGKVFRLYHLLTLCYHLGLRFLTLQEESSTIFVPASTIMVSWSSFMPWSTECSRYKLLAPFRVLSLSLSKWTEASQRPPPTRFFETAKTKIFPRSLVLLLVLQGSFPRDATSLRWRASSLEGGGGLFTYATSRSTRGQVEGPFLSLDYP